MLKPSRGVDVRRDSRTEAGLVPLHVLGNGDADIAGGDPHTFSYVGPVPPAILLKKYLSTGGRWNRAYETVSDSSIEDVVAAAHRQAQPDLQDCLERPCEASDHPSSSAVSPRYVAARSRSASN